MRYQVMNQWEEYHKKYGDLYIKELELEDEAKANAEQSIRKAWEQARQAKEAGQGKLGGKFIEYAYMDCRNNIHALLDSIQHPTKAVQGEYKALLEELLSIYSPGILEDVLVLCGLSKTIDHVNAGCNTVSEIALSIADAIMDEANIDLFIKKEGQKGVDVKWLTKSMEEGISKRVRQSYKVAYATNRMHKEGFNGLNWNKPQRIALGAKVLEMLIKGSGFWEETTSNIEGSKKAIRRLKMTDWFAMAWQTNENNLLANITANPPMIIKPRPWTSPYNGGYYGASTLHTAFIRIHDVKDNKFLRTYRKKLALLDMPIVYGAINAMQETPFHINTYILDCLKEIVARGGELGGVPRTEPLEMPTKLPADATEEEIKEHKQKLIGLHKAEEARKSKALRCLIALQTAEKYSTYDKVYFPWNVDYRGRCYPIPTTLSPQGDDIQKSLLVFAEGTPIKEDDWKWLAIHGANLAGHDKVSFAERIQWVLDNTTNIIASADDPIGYTWWYEESKGDYPMEFLAFCNEWKNLQKYHEDKQEFKGFVSNLPLAFDGTCSGLQHFSALLRDEVGGHAVNLTKTNKVQDIYSLVAEKVNIVLLKDSQSGTEDGWKTNKKGEYVLDKEGEKVYKQGTKSLAQNWVMFNREKFGQDGITRKVCKRSVMTLAYGSKQYGFKENILNDILHPYVLAHPADSVFLNPTQAATYMAKLIWEAVGKTVVKAVEGMAWLQEVSGLICNNNNVVTWMTPNGFPVQQNYMKEETIVKRLRFNNARIYMYTQEATDEINVRRQRNGIAPNFIHSMDACHLQRVVCAERDKGNNNFAMIHDSFGTDCGHAGELYHTIREQFVNLYKDNSWLADFAEQISYMIPEYTMIPKIPEFGKLDLNEVLTSDFCFA